MEKVAIVGCGAGAPFIMIKSTFSGKHGMERIAKLTAPLNIGAVKPRLKT